MTTTLVAVAQSAKARFFRHDGPGKGLQEIAALDHPESALHDGDILTHQHGKTHSPTGQQNGYSSETSPTEVEGERFAKQVAEMITRSRLSKEYDQAVVIAAPSFLGKIRKDLSDADQRFVSGELAKNLADHDVADIESHLGDFISV